MTACQFKVNFSMLSYLMVANNNWRLAYLVKNVLSLPWNSAAAEDCRHTNKTSTKANNFMLSENIVSLLCFQELEHCRCSNQNWSPLDARSVLDCCHRKKRMRWEDRNAQRRILILSSTGSKMEWYLNLPRIYFSIKLRLVKLCLQFEELGQFGVFSFGLLATCMKEIIATCEESQCAHWT